MFEQSTMSALKSFVSFQSIFNRRFKLIFLVKFSFLIDTLKQRLSLNMLYLKVPYSSCQLYFIILSLPSFLLSLWFVFSDHSTQFFFPLLLLLFFTDSSSQVKTSTSKFDETHSGEDQCLRLKIIRKNRRRNQNPFVQILVFQRENEEKRKRKGREEEERDGEENGQLCSEENEKMGSAGERENEKVK